MATKKQRRRRQKGMRHEYEYVYVDDEGREVEVDEDDDEAARPGAKASSAKAAKTPAKRGATRSTRAIQPPSWRRVGKRGLIFAPLMFVVVSILDPDRELSFKVTQTLFLLMIFLPFSYVMDSLTYRMWRRRTAEADGEATRRRR